MKKHNSFWVQLRSVGDMVGKEADRGALLDSLVKDYPNLSAAAAAELRVHLQLVLASIPQITAIMRASDHPTNAADKVRATTGESKAPYST